MPARISERAFARLTSSKRTPASATIVPGRTAPRGTRARTGRRDRAPRPREAEIQRAVVAVLVALGCLVVRVNGGLLPRADGGRMRCSRASRGTCVDLVGVLPDGRALAVEVKRPGETPTAGQTLFLEEVRRRGGVGVVVTSAAEAAAAVGAG